MKPKPFSELKNLTVPVVTIFSSQQTRPVLVTRRSHHGTGARRRHPSSARGPAPMPSPGPSPPGLHPAVVAAQLVGRLGGDGRPSDHGPVVEAEGAPVPRA